jgi:hypothetical protein
MVEFNDNFDDIFNGLFSSKEYELFNKLSKTSIDILGLRKTGDVEILEQEENELVIKTIIYKSFCGKYNFTKVFSYLKQQENDFKLVEIEEQITEAVQKEDYETAAQLKKQKEQLLNK